MTLNPLVLNDCRIYMASADLTGYSNKIQIAASTEELDRTTFGSGGAKERWGGLFDMSASLEGLYQAGDLSMPDDAFWANLGVSTVPLTAVPTSGAVGSLAYLSRVLEAAYKPGGDIGKLLAWSADLKGNWPLVRGTILHPQGTARTATGTGTGQQLGALTASQSLYVTLHVLSVAGTTPSITVAIESDDNSGFTTPTTQTTFAAATALGPGQTAKITGPLVGETWWRAKWTIAGTTPSFLFAVAAGIGPK
jgi:hypothetical protein